MRLQNLLALTHGKLINEPFVNNFHSVVFEAKAIKRGDLFIAFNENEIEEAIENGAYGVIFTKPTQISDNEIAWIKVNDLEDALKRILRFILIEKDIHVYECNEIILKLALQITTESNFIVLSDDIKSTFKKLATIQSATTVLFCPTLTSKDLFTKILVLSKNNIEKINIIEQTLFETSFIYDNIFYERQVLSPFFIPFLEVILHLLKSLKMSYRLRKFIPIDHFEAVFTNKYFEIKEFGTSDKVLIFEQSSLYIKEEIDFLNTEAPWAKTLCIVPENSCEGKHSKEAHLMKTYKNKNEILNILKNNSFHFALIMGADKSILSYNRVPQRELSLFDFK